VSFSTIARTKEQRDMTDTGNTGNDPRTDTGNTGNETTPTSVYGDAETDLTRETARTGAREQVTTGGAMGTSAPMSDAPPSAAGGAIAGATGAGTTTPDAPMSSGAGTTRAGTATEGDAGRLLGDSGELAARWQSVQVIFVDEPRRAVEDADRLVREVMDRLTDVFRLQRDDLEKAWHAGGEASTEDLRVALQRYRSFFERLLAA
jgi:hypothetical protein